MTWNIASVIEITALRAGSPQPVNERYGTLRQLTDAGGENVERGNGCERTFIHSNFTPIIPVVAKTYYCV
jgi:hypothetical protein